jgi:hypothetical protein
VVLDPVLPEARVREPWWQRAWRFVAVGPRRATEGWLEWAISQAMFSALLHLGYFLAVVMMLTAERGYGLVAQLGIAVLLVLGCLLFAGIQWVVVLATMAGVAQLARILVKLPKPWDTAASVVAVAMASWFVEPIGGLLYHALSRELHLWHLGFWVLALGIGGLWGAWLPRALLTSARSAPASR